MSEEIDRLDAEYRGIHMENLRTEKERKKGWSHPIFLFDPASEDIIGDINGRLNQIVNVYEHTMDDFEFNSKKIIKYFRKHYGDGVVSMFTIAQSISFRVYKGQKEPFHLPLFSFLVNYTMLILPVMVGSDLTDWTPMNPPVFSSGEWCARMDKYIMDARPKANMRRICECVEMSKWLMNLWCAKAGERLGLSISNNEFIEVMKRSEDARESMTCSFDIPDDITPIELEQMTMKRTDDLLSFISKQVDLSISVYARNHLFNPGQFREYAVHICYKPDLYGNTIPYTCPTNIMMGTADPRAFTVDAYGARKAEIIKLNVADAGTLERSLSMMMSRLRTVDINYECSSRHFRKRYISSQNDLDKLDGRVGTLDKDSDEFIIVDPRNTSLIGKYIYLKTPITCTHPRRKEGVICSACYGKLMASLNRDVHIGRLAAVESADEIEQKLLSAKHILQTNTVDIGFGDDFNRFFELGNGQIRMNESMVEASMDPESEFSHLYLEFHPDTMKKEKDGESRHYDRSVQEIIVYDDRDDSHLSIAENNGSPIYLSPEFNDSQFLPALKYRDEKDVIRIPFTDIIDTGRVVTLVLFEFAYRNNELTAPLMKLESILFNGTNIAAFRDYNDCLDTLIPLFVKGGIHLPDYQAEMLVSQLITTPDGEMVDWNDPNPEYMFNSINKSIQRSQSALTSVLFQESSAQIAGAHGTYEKSGTSDYDWFIMEHREQK